MRKSVSCRVDFVVVFPAPFTLPLTTKNSILSAPEFRRLWRRRRR